MFSSESSEWHTPKELFHELNYYFNFDLDPCTTEDNPLNTPHFFTIKDNGLEKEWFGNVFVNPPYNKEIEKWLKKAKHELRNGFTRHVVFLLPARTDTKWFHQYIYDTKKWDFKFHVKLRFLKGRLKFGNSKNSAPFPSMIVIFSR